jgi:Tol biopolymer transport system component
MQDMSGPDSRNGTRMPSKYQLGRHDARVDEERKMKPLLFVMMLSFLAVSLVTAQKPATVSPKHYKVAAAEVPDLSVTPDGRYRLYAEKTGGGDVHLFVRDLTTGESRSLTEGPGSLVGWRMSPDGRLIAYFWGNALETEDPRIELRIVGIDGSGRGVLYSDGNGPFLNGARLNLILNPPLLLHGWSPDGKYVAATIFQRDQSQLVLFSAAEASVRMLKRQGRETVSHHSYFDEIKFSPDARFVAYDRTSPGSSRRDIIAIPVEGGPEVPLVQHRANDRLVDWTPDGRGVLFASDRSGRWDLWVMPVTDGKPRGSPQMIYPNIGPRPFFNSLGLTREGSYSYGVKVWENDVYLATLDPATSRLRGPTKLVSQVGSRTSTQWSRDGQYLAYVRGEGDFDDPFVLGIRSAATGKERRLRLGELRRMGNHGFDPQWSPDGRFILATLRKLDYRQGAGLYRIDVQTGAVTPVVPTDSSRGYNRHESAAWSRDGRMIFERRPPPAIVTRNVETGEERELYRPTPPAEVYHWPTSNLSVSPDGQRIAFVWSDAQSEGTTALMVLPTAGGAPHALVRAKDPARIGVTAWTPDSRHIIYARSLAGDKGYGPGVLWTTVMFEFWRVAVDGGEPENLGLRMEARAPFGLSVHPDGTRIAFTAGTEQRTEVWVLKDFLPGLKQ